MSDPNPRPSGERTPRKGASPLIWILVLIALLAFGWYFYNQRGATSPPPMPADAVPPVAVGSERDAAARRERDRAALRAQAAGSAAAGGSTGDGTAASGAADAPPASGR
jgi:periplasmic protein TonB